MHKSARNGHTSHCDLMDGKQEPVCFGAGIRTPALQAGQSDWLPLRSTLFRDERGIQSFYTFVFFFFPGQLLKGNLNPSFNVSVCPDSSTST